MAQDAEGLSQNYLAGHLTLAIDVVNVVPSDQVLLAFNQDVYKYLP
jgi:hypothetical protein